MYKKEWIKYGYFMEMSLVAFQDAVLMGKIRLPSTARP